MRACDGVLMISGLLSLYVVSGTILVVFRLYQDSEITSFYTEESASSFVTCAAYCRQSAPCVAATFDAILQLCQLSESAYLISSTSSLDKGTIVLTGVMYGDRFTLPVFLDCIPTCTNLPFHKEPTTSPRMEENRHFCQFFIEEYDQPRPKYKRTSGHVCSIAPMTIANGTLVVTQTPTGANADLLCDMYFKPASSSPKTITCTNETGWEDSSSVACVPVTPYTWDTSYITAFMVSNGYPTLMITSQEPALIQINIPYLGVDDVSEINRTQPLIYQTNGIMATNDTIEQKVVHVTSNTSIHLYSGNKHTGGSDGSTVIPLSSWGETYFVAGFPSSSGNDEILIISSENATTVTLEFPLGTIKTITLDANNTYLLQAHDLSGTKVSSTKPILVLSGNTCAAVPDSSVHYCDFIQEAMPPITSLGTTHVISYMNPRPDFTISIIVTQDLTDISFFNRTGILLETLFNQTQATQIFRRFYGYMTISVTSNKPIMVHQYGHGGESFLGDPSMMFIPDVGFYSCQYSFAIPPVFTSSTLTVVISDLMSVSMLKLNDNTLSPMDSVSVIVPDKGSYTVLYADIMPGSHILSDDQAGTGMIYGAWVYGRTHVQESAWALGFAA